MNAPIIDRAFTCDPADLLPAINADNEPFWNGLAEGRLLLQQCGNCHRTRHPIAPVCPYCGRLDWQWHQATGRGRVFSFVCYRRNYLPEFEPLMPYVVLTVQLDEGPRMFGLLRDRHVPVPINTPVSLVVERWPNGRAVAAFVASEGAAT